LHFVAAPSHLRKYSVEVHIVDARRVLENNPSGLDFFKHTQSFRPEPAVISLASLLPGATCRLTWWSSCEKANSAVSSTVEGSDVWVNGESPSPFKEGAAALVFFAEGDGAEPSCSSGKSKPSESAEDVEVGWPLIHAQSPLVDGQRRLGSGCQQQQRFASGA
jgi:hypothetical protein